MALNIKSGIRKRAQKCVLYGPEGIGKSTFASQFPSPLFIDTEGSTDHMDVARLDRPTSWAMLLGTIKEFSEMPMSYQTLVIDTIDWAEELCIQHICAVAKKRSIEDFGYGSGYIVLLEEMGKLLNALDEVVAKGVNVLLTAHCQLRKFEQPDDLGAYDRYELKLGRKTSAKTSALVKEWADAVLFVNYKNNIISQNGKNKATQGMRVMYTEHKPAFDAKNRWGLAPELPFEFKQIEKFIPTNIVGDDLKAFVGGAQTFDEVKTVAVNVPINQSVEQVPFVDSVPPALKDLMRKDGITLEQIQKCVVARGQYPEGTPFENYDPEFITGWIIPFWGQLVNFIKSNNM